MHISGYYVPADDEGGDDEDDEDGIMGFDPAMLEEGEVRQGPAWRQRSECRQIGFGLWYVNL